MPREISDRGRDAIVEHEGLRLKPYDDATGKDWIVGRPAKGYPTIGVGHLLTKRELNTHVLAIGGREVSWPGGITHEDALELLEQDLDEAEADVEELAQGLNDNQFAALVSFVFNTGRGGLEIRERGQPPRPSGVLRAILDGRYEDVPAQLARWNRSMGKVNNGLVRRRKAEGELWSR